MAGHVEPKEKAPDKLQRHPTSINVTLTRKLLLQLLDDPAALVQLTAFDVKPVEVEEKIAEALRYLESTSRRAKRPGPSHGSHSPG